jgi:hypothetical protein
VTAKNCKQNKLNRIILICSFQVELDRIKNVPSLRGARYAERENAVGVTITVAGIRVPSSVA